MGETFDRMFRQHDIVYTRGYGAWTWFSCFMLQLQTLTVLLTLYRHVDCWAWTLLPTWAWVAGVYARIVLLRDVAASVRVSSFVVMSVLVASGAMFVDNALAWTPLASPRSPWSLVLLGLLVSCVLTVVNGLIRCGNAEYDERKPLVLFVLLGLQYACPPKIITFSPTRTTKTLTNISGEEDGGGDLLRSSKGMGPDYPDLRDRQIANHGAQELDSIEGSEADDPEETAARYRDEHRHHHREQHVPEYPPPLPPVSPQHMPPPEAVAVSVAASMMSIAPLGPADTLREAINSSKRQHADAAAGSSQNHDDDDETDEDDVAAAEKSRIHRLQPGRIQGLKGRIKIGNEGDPSLLEQESAKRTMRKYTGFDPANAGNSTAKVFGDLFRRLYVSMVWNGAGYGLFQWSVVILVTAQTIVFMIVLDGSKNQPWWMVVSPLLVLSMMQLQFAVFSACVPKFPRLVSVAVVLCRICTLAFFSSIINVWALLMPFAAPIFVICIPVVVETSIYLFAGMYMACCDGYYDYKLGVFYLQTGDCRGFLQTYRSATNSSQLRSLEIVTDVCVSSD